jgi:hypothetical protein
MWIVRRQQRLDQCPLGVGQRTVVRRLAGAHAHTDTAKTVLRETGGTWARNAKFPILISDAQKALGLMVGTLAPDKAGDTSLKMVLDGLDKVAIGIDELRNPLRPRPRPRHPSARPHRAARPPGGAQRHGLLPLPPRHPHRPGCALA